MDSSKKERLLARALCATEEKQNQLGLKAGDIVEVIEQSESGWWGGKIFGQKNRGWFPMHYVTPLSPEEAATIRRQAEKKAEKPPVPKKPSGPPTAPVGVIKDLLHTKLLNDEEKMIVLHPGQRVYLFEENDEDERMVSISGDLKDAVWCPNSIIGESRSSKPPLNSLNSSVSGILESARTSNELTQRSLQEEAKKEQSVSRTQSVPHPHSAAAPMNKSFSFTKVDRPLGPDPRQPPVGSRDIGLTATGNVKVYRRRNEEGLTKKEFNIGGETKEFLVKEKPHFSNAQKNVPGITSLDESTSDLHRDFRLQLQDLRRENHQLAVQNEELLEALQQKAENQQSLQRNKGIQIEMDNVDELKSQLMSCAKQIEEQNCYTTQMETTCKTLAEEKSNHAKAVIQLKNEILELQNRIQDSPKLNKTTRIPHTWKNIRPDERASQSMNVEIVHKENEINRLSKQVEHFKTELSLKDKVVESFRKDIDTQHNEYNIILNRYRKYVKSYEGHGCVDDSVLQAIEMGEQTSPGAGRSFKAKLQAHEQTAARNPLMRELDRLRAEVRQYKAEKSENQEFRRRERREQQGEPEAAMDDSTFSLPPEPVPLTHTGNTHSGNLPPRPSFTPRIMESPKPLNISVAPSPPPYRQPSPRARQPSPRLATPPNIESETNGGWGMSDDELGLDKSFSSFSEEDCTPVSKATVDENIQENTMSGHQSTPPHPNKTDQGQPRESSLTELRAMFED